jgi:hypothetical protein
MVIAAILIGGASVGWFNSSDRDLQRLLGASGAGWLDHAQVAAWQPDPNLKPVSYFVRRSIDEAAFRQLASDSHLTVVPSATSPEAIWQLPAGATIAGWGAANIPAGGGLDARGSVGEVTLFARWYDGQAWLVISPSER